MDEDAAAPAPDAGAQQAPDSGSRVNDQIRQMIMQVGQLAQAVPEAQQELGVAAKALTAASLKLVAGQQGPPQGQPVIGA